MTSAGSTLTPMVTKLAQRTPLGAAERDALLSLPHRTAQLRRGSFIAREGEKPLRFCLLLSGFVYRYKLTGDGARQILAVHVQGDLVDLQNGLLAEADHNVQPLTGIEVAFIPQEAILDVAAAFPRIARALLTDIAATASILSEWLLNVGQRNARERVCHLLCELAVRQAAAGIRVGADYAWPITQEQLGDATGLTSVHINWTLQALRRDGLLSPGSRQVNVTDWHRLREQGDFTPAYLHLRDRDNSHAEQPGLDYANRLEPDRASAA